LWFGGIIPTMLFRFRVIVMPRKDLLDPQGRAVSSVLRDMGMKVGDVRIGRSIEVEVEADGEEEALKMVDRMASEVLSNPIIEDYSIQRL